MPWQVQISPLYVNVGRDLATGDDLKGAKQAIKLIK